MNDPQRGQRAAYLGFLLGGIFLPLTMPAMSARAAGVDPGQGLAAATVPAQAALMLATNWQTTLDPSAFLVSEKLDGVRAYWDGYTLRFKSGRAIAAPAWFTAALPATPLDGELWLGRGSFDRLSGIVRRSEPVESEWRQVRYMVFDVPGIALPFGERVLRISSLVGDAGVAWLQAVAQYRLADHTMLQRQLLLTVADGGEGLVLHRADALWHAGRSDALRKLKQAPDEDARVLAIVPGQGRLAGRMGALLLEMANGQRFTLGTGFTDAQRAGPPAVGAVVTYRYRGRTPSGLPRFASFLRMRDAE